MVKSLENGTALAPFLVKCYEMVDDDSTNELISWTESNDSFIIWDEAKFSSELLPKYFKHSNFSSFVRQLNIYGFRKIDTDRWEFGNELFIKGQKHLLKNITRRKQPQTLVQRNSSQQKDVNTLLPSEEEKRLELWKEVENLKAGKNALTQELKKLRQHQQNSQDKLLLLREQLKGMEKNQQQMLSFIIMAMQRPEFLMQFLQPKENNWRAGENGNTNNHKLSEVTDDFEFDHSDRMIVKYQPQNNEEPSKSEDLMGLDLTSDELKDLLMDIENILGSGDENLGSSEDNGTLENDAMLEELLSAIQVTENEESTSSIVPVSIKPGESKCNQEP